MEFSTHWNVQCNSYIVHGYKNFFPDMNYIHFVVFVFIQVFSQEPGQCNWCSEESTGWKSQKSWFDSQNWKDIICSPKCPDQIWGSYNLLLNGTESSVPERKEFEVKAGHSHLFSTTVNNKWRSTSTPYTPQCVSDGFHLCILRINMSFVQMPEQ